MFDYFFFIIYIFLDFEKSIALNKFDLSNPSINVDCIHKNPEKEECMKDIGAGREGRVKKRGRERNRKRWRGGRARVATWKKGRKEREIDGPERMAKFSVSTFLPLCTNKAATEYKVEPLPLVRKSFTSSLFSFPVRGLSTSLHKRELLLQMEYIVPPEYSLS